MGDILPSAPTMHAGDDETLLMRLRTAEETGDKAAVSILVPTCRISSKDSKQVAVQRVDTV